MGGGIKNKARVLFVMDALLKHTDEEHRLSAPAIIDMLQAQGFSANRKSIYDDIAALQEWGMDIVFTKETPQGYYLASRDFELPELKLLVDAVQSSKFITTKKSRQLIKKLEALASEREAKQLQRNVHITNRNKTINESIYYNVDKIHSAISANKKISFIYCQWSLDKELVPRGDGKVYGTSPWELTWDDENYYMIGYDDEAQIMKNYRVDKMQKIEIIDEARTGEESFKDFDITKMAKSTFNMFSGNAESVALECRNSLIGVIIDRFGSDIIIQKNDDGTFLIRQDVVVNGQFYGWLCGLGEDIKIVAPQSAVERYKEWIQNISKLY